MERHFIVLCDKGMHTNENLHFRTSCDREVPSVLHGRCEVLLIILNVKSKRSLLRGRALLKCVLGWTLLLAGLALDSGSPSAPRFGFFHTSTRKCLTETSRALSPRPRFSQRLPRRHQNPQPSSSKLPCGPPGRTRLGPRAVSRTKHVGHLSCRVLSITWDKWTEQETPSWQCHKDKVDFWQEKKKGKFISTKKTEKTSCRVKCCKKEREKQ